MPISGGPGQQAIPRPTRAMPATRATGMATPVSSLTQQQLPNKRWNNKQRQSGCRFSNCRENQKLFHAPISLNSRAGDFKGER